MTYMVTGAVGSVQLTKGAITAIDAWAAVGDLKKTGVRIVDIRYDDYLYTEDQLKMLASAERRTLT